MKVNVQANDFCPDNCPFCEVEKIVFYMDAPPLVECKCRYADICEYAVAQYKEQERSKGNGEI